MGEIIIGTEAVHSGVVTRHELRRWYRPFLPNVHAPKGHELTLRDRALGAWLWSGRRGIVTGLAAAELHGSRWIAADADVELIFKCPRPPAGLICRAERVVTDEWEWLDGMQVANPTRTAFDLGRFQRGGSAVARLDALMQATPYSLDDVLALARRYRGRHGVARLKAALPSVDGGAQSPRETWWRMFLVEQGFPRPATQIPVVDDHGRALRVLDFGWQEYQVAVEYDGDQHQSDRLQYLKDRWVMPALERLGWTVVSIVKEDDTADVVRALYHAMTARGWNGAGTRAEAVCRQRDVERWSA
jgi:hypothetical protein